MTIKRLIRIIVLQPWVLLLRFLMWMRILQFSDCGEILSVIPAFIGRELRYAFYRSRLARCGDHVVFEFGTIVLYPAAEIGDHVRLGRFNLVGVARIGDYVMSGQSCHFLSGGKTHGFEDTTVPMILQPFHRESITIGDDVWIGQNSVVMNDIGTGSVIGAGSVVVKPVAPYSVVAGNPAKLLRSRVPEGVPDAG